MLDIEIEMKKGIMFIRVNGELSKRTINKWNTDVKDLIVDNGIRNIVLNVEHLTAIDSKGINSLLYSYEVCNTNKGTSVLCGLNDAVKERIKHSHLLKFMKEVDSERTALSLIKV